MDLLRISSSTGRNRVVLNLDPGYPVEIPLSIATAADANTTAAGWGLTSGSGDPANDLLDVDLPAVGCPTSAGTNICAGTAAGGIDACSGDSGGPLWAWSMSRQLQVGVVSSGPADCGAPNTLGRYVRISAVADWIAGVASDAEFMSPAAVINATRIL